MRDSEVYASIVFHGLKRCARFDTLNSQDFARIYNGYGPDAWHKKTIKTLTWIFGMFPEIAGVHDVDCYFSDGTRKGFSATCKRWKQNCSIMLNARYPLSSPSLYLHRSVAWFKLLIAYKAISTSTAYQYYLKAHQNLIAKRGY